MSNSTQTSASNRINALLDESSFVEVGSYITARNTDFNLTDKETPADGVITGYGTIDGSLVYVYSQDASVLGGSLGAVSYTHLDVYKRQTVQNTAIFPNRASTASCGG